MSSAQYDAIVMGAGIGGLTCGAFLARAGMRVLVLEQHTKIGGYAHAFTRRGYRFESGIHSVPLNPDSIIMHLLRLLDADRHIETIELPSMYRFDSPSGSYRLPTRYNDIVEQLCADFPREKANVKRLIADIDRVYETVGRVLLGFEQQFLDEDTAFVSGFHNRSIADYVSSFIDDERLRQVFYGMWPYAGKQPERAPSLFYIVMLAIHLFEGSHFVKGGFGSVAAALERSIIDRGGEVKTRSKVVRLVADGERVREAVTAAGESYSGGLFVSNMSPYVLHGSLLDKSVRNGLWMKRLNRLNPSLSCVAAYLGMRDDVTSILEDTITFWFGTTAPQHPFGRKLAGGPDDLDHLILLATRPDDVPSTLTLMNFVDPALSTDWRRDKRLVAEAMLAKADRLYPGLRDLVDIEVVGSPDTFERFTGNTGGALYGFENDRSVYAEAKLPNKTHIENLYQTGHWGKPGGGIWNVMHNAYRTSKIIERDTQTRKAPAQTKRRGDLKLRLVYPKFRKFLEGHDELRDLIRDHVVGDYTMPPSLALPIIAALTPSEMEVALTDDNIGQPLDFDEAVDLVVVSCFTPQASRAYAIADEYRKRGTKVILGGIHPTSAPEEAMQHADAVCVGEVEPVWGRILDDLRHGRLGGIYRHDGDFPLAKMPIPKRDIFNSGNYRWEAHLVLTTRGCPVNCAGCPIPNKEGALVRLRPIDNVIKDIESMPYREFYITDDTVMLPGKKYSQYLLRLMERTKGMDIHVFLASTMTMLNDPEFYRKLAAGGAASMYTVFGYDRVSRRLFSPECTAEEWQQAVDLVRMIEDAGIHFFASYGVGFDEQDAGIGERILRFSDEAGIDLAEFYINTPFPGTPFGRAVEEQNRVLHRNYDLWNTGNVVFRPVSFSEEGLLREFLNLWKTFYADKDPKQTLRSFRQVNEAIAE
ncbi:MAG: NAD(P)-binding protein [Chitinivibrionales bacterium]|nr:NAD(P)-binding protein [Chitinivibrionales bacterium]